MTEKYRVHDLAKFNYSEIGEYIDENHTDRPLRNDILVDLLNQLNDENEQLKHDATVLICSNQEYRKENEELKEEIKDLNDVLARYEEKELKE